MDDKISFRRSTNEDWERISDFRKQFEFDPAVRCYDSEYYQWKIRENPIQSGEIWLAEINDQFVGMKSMTPKSLLFEKRLIDAAETGDTFTHRDFQRRGIFTSLFESALKEQTLDATVAFTYGVANEQSRPAYEKRLNYGLLPIKVNRWVKPIKFWKTNGTRRAIATRPILTAYSNCVEWFAKLTTEKNVRIIKVTEFPSDCDELFGKLSRNYDALFVRDKQSLDWRFVKNPDSYDIYTARTVEGELLGYLVTKLANFENQPSLGFVVDYFAVEHKSSIFRMLLLESYRDFRTNNVDSILTWSVKSSFFERQFLLLGFLPNFREKFSIICLKNQLGNLMLSKKLKWHFTHGDTDSI